MENNKDDLPVKSRRPKTKIMGRPIKLNDEVREKIVQIVRAGNYIETAAAYAGVSKDSLYGWMRRGEREKVRLANGEKPSGKEQIFVAFVDAISIALAESEARDVAIIGRAAESAWQASAWRLERKFPDRWGRKDRIEHAGVDGKAIQVEQAIETTVNVKDLTDEQLRLLLSVVGKTADPVGAEIDRGPDQEGGGGTVPA